MRGMAAAAREGMTFLMGLLVALVSDTAPARLEIAELPGGVFLVGWDELQGSGALAFQREQGADETRYLPIGGGPFAILDRGRRTLVAGTSVPVFEIVIDADHPERMRLDVGRKVDVAALTAKYEAFEHVAPPGESKSAIEAAITTELARANKACGGKLAPSIDWAAFGKAQRLAKQAIGILEALASTELTMQDLAALDKQHAWGELLAKAEQVKPSARTADWEKLVRSAAAHVVEMIAKDLDSDWSAAAELIATLPAAEHQYAFLRGDKPYTEGKAKVIQRLSALCVRDELGDCGVAIAQLAEGVDKLPKGVAREIALRIAAERAPVDGIKFFALAAEEDPAICQFGDLERAVLSGLHGANDLQVAQAQRAAAACYAALEITLTKELEGKDETFIKNACPVLKTHGTMTVAKKKRCK